jgi:hypothetical protein
MATLKSKSRAGAAQALGPEKLVRVRVQRHRRLLRHPFDISPSGDEADDVLLLLSFRKGGRRI